MKKLILLTFCTLFLSQVGFSQDDDTSTKNWKRSGTLGLDLAQLLLINPKFGAGENKLGLGGVAGYAADYAKGKWIWENKIGWQFAAQRLGSSENSFTKNVDQLDLVSKGGYAITEDKKWFAALEYALRTQVTSTFGTNQLSREGESFGVTEQDANGDDVFGVIEEEFSLLSEFFSPAIMTLTPGVDYKPTEHLSFLLSPATSRLIYVANDNLAALGVHGNEVNQNSLQADGTFSDFDNTFYQLGASITANYNNKYFNDKFIFGSRLFLFSNYLDSPERIDIEWTNEFAYEIFKGLALSLNIGVYYDHDVLVQVDRNDNGFVQDDVGGRRVQLVEGFNIKYTKAF